MENRKSMTGHHAARALVIGGLSYYIVHLHRSGALLLYIAPRMELYVKLAAVGLFVIAACQVYFAIRSFAGKPESCECAHEPPRTRWGSGLVYGLLLIPLLLGFALPDTVLNSNIVAIKGMNLTPYGATATAGTNGAVRTAGVSEGKPDGSDLQAGPIRGEEPEQPRPQAESAGPLDGKLDELFPPEPYMEEFADFAKRLYKQDVIDVMPEGFMERMTALDLYKDAFVGKKVTMTGFVYREDDMPVNQFVVSRLAMQCCSADAVPYGVLTESPMGDSYAKDTWVTVEGKLGKTVYNGNEIIKVDVVKIKVVEAPESPYVYPFFDDFNLLPAGPPEEPETGS